MTAPGLAVVAIAFGAACGDGEAKPPREVNADDLSLMVLQREDVPAAFSLLEEDGETRGFVEPLYSQGAAAMFVREFELPPDQAESATVVCIINSAVLYETSGEAKKAFREVRDFQRDIEINLEESGDEIPWSEIDSASLPPLGDERQVLRFAAPATDFCSYKGEPSEAYFLASLRYNVGAGLGVWTYGEGASLDEAIQLAQKQASRIDTVFEANSND